MSWRIVRAMILGAVLSAGVGCFGEPVYEGLACSVDRPCPAGFLCTRAEMCARLCEVDDGCRIEGERCIDGLCVSTSSAAAAVWGR